MGPYQCHDVGPLVFVLWGHTSHVGPLVFVLWGHTSVMMLVLWCLSCGVIPVMLVLWCLSCGAIPESCWSSGVCPVGPYQSHVGPLVFVLWGHTSVIGPLVFVLWGHTSVMMLVLWCLSCGAIPESCWSSGVCPVGPY